MTGSACKSLPYLLHALIHFGEANEAGIHSSKPTFSLEKGQRSQQGKGSSDHEYQLHSSNSANTVLLTALTKGVTGDLLFKPHNGLHHVITE